MARSALPTFEGPRPQYFSLMMNAARILGQVRSIEVQDTINSEQAGRVGSSTKKTLKKGKEATFNAQVWVDDDLQEVAIFLNAAALPTTGNTVKLDPSMTPKTWRLLNYNSEAASATLLSTTYLYNALALEFGLTLDEDGEQVATISGSLEDLYTVLV